MTADDIVIYFLIFHSKTEFDNSCKFLSEETICMNDQILFSGKHTQTHTHTHTHTHTNTIKLSSPECAQRVVTVNVREFPLMFYVGVVEGVM